MSSKVAAVPDHVSDNIETIAELRQSVEQRMNRHQRAVETATSAIGRPQTLYFLAALVLGWTVYNAEAAHHALPVFDAAPFFWLQGLISLYAAFVATMVLTAQNRQRRESEQRSHLELQVNLLSEQKATKIIALLEELRHDLPMVSDREDLLAEALQQQVDPKAVLSEIESAMEPQTTAPVSSQSSEAALTEPSRSSTPDPA